MATHRPRSRQGQLGLTQTNKTYTFTAVPNVPNATGAPFAYSPEVSIDGEGTAFLCQACLGSAVTITDATLDGNVPGSGSATFSVAETGLTWRVAHSDSFDVDYQGTTPAPDAALRVTRIAAVVDGGRHAAVGVTFTDDDPAGSLSQYSGTVAWGDGSTTTIPKYLFTKIPARLGGGFAAGSPAHLCPDRQPRRDGGHQRRRWRLSQQIDHPRRAIPLTTAAA